MFLKGLRVLLLLQKAGRWWSLWQCSGVLIVTSIGTDRLPIPYL